jgi:hypothetical protein
MRFGPQDNRKVCAWLLAQSIQYLVFSFNFRWETNTRKAELRSCCVQSTLAAPNEQALPLPCHIFQ